MFQEQFNRNTAMIKNLYDEDLKRSAQTEQKHKEQVSRAERVEQRAEQSRAEREQSRNVTILDKTELEISSSCYSKQLKVI